MKGSEGKIWANSNTWKRSWQVGDRSPAWWGGDVPGGGQMKDRECRAEILETYSVDRKYETALISTTH